MTGIQKSPQKLSKEVLLPLMANHVLIHGMGGASLRPLAKAAGTSDRMLIYHFGNKERLIADVLAYIARAYSEVLDASLSGERSTSRRELIDRIIERTNGSDMEPFLALWWEIVAGSARDLPGYRVAAKSVMSQLLAWLTKQMPSNDPDPSGGATYLLTMIEGAQMLSAIGHDEIGMRGLRTASL